VTVNCEPITVTLAVTEIRTSLRNDAKLTVKAKTTDLTVKAIQYTTIFDDMILTSVNCERAYDIMTMLLPSPRDFIADRLALSHTKIMVGDFIKDPRNGLVGGEMGVRW